MSDDEQITVAVPRTKSTDLVENACCAHVVARHAYNGCADCGCAVRWSEHIDCAGDAADEHLMFHTYDRNRADARGGQHVAKFDAVVIVVHVPTGIAAECRTERSQLGCKARAVARVRLLVLREHRIALRMVAAITASFAPDGLIAPHARTMRVARNMLAASVCDERGVLDTFADIGIEPRPELVRALVDLLRGDA